MLNDFTGVKTLNVDLEAISELQARKTMSFEKLKQYAAGFSNEDFDWAIYPNLFLALTAFDDEEKKHVVMVRVGHKGDEVWLLKDYTKFPVYNIKPRNKEQNMLLNTLMDDRIACQVILGPAGTGKTVLTLAYALHQLFERKGTPYEKIILTRPMSSVGEKMGAFPGEPEEKMAPYLGNFYDNLEQIMGRNGRAYLESAIAKGHVEIMPIQLIGGSSWHNSIVIADEIQTLKPEELYALGTRPAQGTKLVLMGDLKQRYGNRGTKEGTGIYKAATSELFHRSPITAMIRLRKVERSELAALFDTVFSDFT